MQINTKQTLRVLHVQSDAGTYICRDMTLTRWAPQKCGAVIRMESVTVNPLQHQTGPSQLRSQYLSALIRYSTDGNRGAPSSAAR